MLIGMVAHTNQPCHRTCPSIVVGSVVAFNESGREGEKALVYFGRDARKLIRLLPPG